MRFLGNFSSKAMIFQFSSLQKWRNVEFWAWIWFFPWSFWNLEGFFSLGVCISAQKYKPGSDKIANHNHQTYVYKVWRWSRGRLFTTIPSTADTINGACHIFWSGNFSVVLVWFIRISMCLSIRLFQTHDNPSPLEKRGNVKEVLSNAALTTMSACAVG